MDRETFDELRREWVDATRRYSFMQQKAMNRAYQRIIGGGRRSLPHIFRSMRAREDGWASWGWALTAITGEDPVDEEHRGYVELMAADWLAWADENGYVAERDDGDPAPYPYAVERVGFMEDGRLDEIVLGEFHLEHLQQDTWWFRIGGINCVCRDVQIDFVNQFTDGRVPPGLDSEEWESEISSRRTSREQRKERGRKCRTGSPGTKNERG